MEAVLRCGPDAHLTRDAVLALHGLALVSPRRIRVGSPQPSPSHPPRLDRGDPRAGRARRPDSYEGIPSTTVRRALLDCRDIVMIDRLVEATEEAGRRGLVLRHQLAGASRRNQVRPIMDRAAHSADQSTLAHDPTRQPRSAVGTPDPPSSAHRREHRGRPDAPVRRHEGRSCDERARRRSCQSFHDRSRCGASHRSHLDDYLNELARRLDVGWGGFTGTLEQLTPAEPEGVAEQYVMQPFKIRLLYLGRHWLTVPFELGHDEIGNTKQHELRSRTTS